MRAYSAGERQIIIEVAGSISDAAGRINDDRLGFCGDTLWVLDGATDVSAAKLLPGGSDAAWIAEAFSQALDALIPEFDGTLYRLAERATMRVAAAFEREKLASPANRGLRPSAAGLLLRLRHGWAETLSMGDCELLVSLPGEPARLAGADPLRLGDRGAIARVRGFAQARGLSWRDAREALRPSLSQGRARMNLPGGYAVFSLDMPPEALVRQDRFPVPPGTRILMMSDGFARLREVFHAYTEASLLEAAFGKGLAALLGELRALEAEDSGCEQFARMKARDDASALLVTIR
jgi:hypothetical protein